MRRERPSVALVLRMLLAGTLTPLFVAAAFVGLVVLIPDPFKLVMLGAIVIAGIAVATEQRRKALPTTRLGVLEAPELHATLERLCVQADLPKPELVLVLDHHGPGSWVTDLPGRRPRLHVKPELLELLTPSEVEAVVAHELSHVAHRDAVVMTLVGLPGSALRDGSGHLMHGFFLVGAVLGWLIGTVAGWGTNVLSRSRELAADAGAARLTGRPAALSSALLKVSGEICRVPEEDLRSARARNALNLLPVPPAPRTGWRRRVPVPRVVKALEATHPSLDGRLAALERLERERRRLHG